jgi:hypothetical protein
MSGTMADHGKARYSTAKPNLTTHQQLRDKTQADIDEFLANKGKIEVLPGPTESVIYKAGWNATGIL